MQSDESYMVHWLQAAHPTTYLGHPQLSGWRDWAASVQLQVDIQGIPPLEAPAPSKHLLLTDPAPLPQQVTANWLP